MMSNTQVIPGQTEWDPKDADQVPVPLCGGVFKDESGSTEKLFLGLELILTQTFRIIHGIRPMKNGFFLQNYLTGLSQRLKVLIIQDNSDH